MNLHTSICVNKRILSIKQTNVPKQRSADQERRPAGKPKLPQRHDTPTTHLDRNPNVRAKLLRHELRGQFGAKESQAEDCITQVEIVRVHLEVGEEVVRIGLGEVTAVKVELLNMFRN